MNKQYAKARTAKVTPKLCHFADNPLIKQTPSQYSHCGSEVVEPAAIRGSKIFAKLGHDLTNHRQGWACLELTEPKGYKANVLGRTFPVILHRHIIDERKSFSK